MSRKLGKKVVLAGTVMVPEGKSITEAALAQASSVVVPVEDDEPLPRTLEAVEAIVDKAGRLSSGDRAKAKALLTTLKVERDKR